MLLFLPQPYPPKGAFLLSQLAKESSAKPTVSREYVPRPFNASELPIQSRELSTVVVFESIAGDSFPRDDLFAQRPNSSRLSEESRKNPVTMRQVLTNECYWCSDAGLCQIKELRCDRTQRGRRRRRSVGVFSEANITWTQHGEQAKATKMVSRFPISKSPRQATHQIH